MEASAADVKSESEVECFSDCEVTGWLSGIMTSWATLTVQCLTNLRGSEGPSDLGPSEEPSDSFTTGLA